LIELVWAAGGLVVGVVVAWSVARARFTGAAHAAAHDLGTRLAGAETLGDELRKQVSQRELELADLRGTLESERTVRVQAEAREVAARAGLDEQRRLLEEGRERLSDTFRALSADVLRQSGDEFLARARETVEGQLQRRAEAMDASIQPLRDALERYDEHVRALEAVRARAHGTLEEQLRALAVSHADLARETGNLVSALRAPQVRGRWGELTLHRVVELAGLTEHCDYVEQATTEGASGRLRPDMIVHLPGGRDIIVDAKVPLTAYLEAVEAPTADGRASAFLRHAQQVRQHMLLLAGKQYWEQLTGTVELVIMFIPGEAFVGAAVEADPGLLEEGMTRRVLVATPTTLIAVLRAIASGWRQERLAVNAVQISEMGRLLYDRLRTFAGHVDDVGTALGKAVHAYNSAVGSMESRVLPAARRFRELGAAGGEEIAALEAVDERPRPLIAQDVPEQLRAPETGG
jgi:DNA recombination protein RmuC